jgi:hypothetical protein
VLFFRGTGGHAQIPLALPEILAAKMRQAVGGHPLASGIREIVSCERQSRQLARQLFGQTLA